MTDNQSATSTIPSTVTLAGQTVTRVGLGTNRLRHTAENVAFVETLRQPDFS